MTGTWHGQGAGRAAGSSTAQVERGLSPGSSRNVEGRPEPSPELQPAGLSPAVLCSHSEGARVCACAERAGNTTAGMRRDPSTEKGSRVFRIGGFRSLSQKPCPLCPASTHLASLTGPPTEGHVPRGSGRRVRAGGRHGSRARLPGARGAPRTVATTARAGAWRPSTHQHAAQGKEAPDPEVAGARAPSACVQQHI